MSRNGGSDRSPARLDLRSAATSRRRAGMVAGLRGLARGPGAGARETAAAPAGSAAEPEERCDLCATSVPDDHRHMLNLDERQIVCVCESCWALRSGEPQFRPVGTRTLWLEGFRMPADVWAGFGIPIGLAFFLHSSVTECVVALYPSPAGATESELHFSTWNELRALNPVLDDLEPDAEALIVNRLSDPPAYAIAPIDRCYGLVGLVKASWEGISGGAAVAHAVDGFFARLREDAVAP
jgi:hypothetical protein